MHAPKNNYLTAKSKGLPTSVKMEAEFMPWFGETWHIVEKDRFPFSVIYRFKIILDGELVEGGSTT